MTLRPALLVLMMLAAPVIAMAADGKPVMLSGAVVNPGPIGEDIARLPPIEMDVSFMTKNGKETGRYKGVLLWDLLEARGFGSLEGHHPELLHTFVVTGSDDYAIAFSVGEIAPEFGNRQMLLATERDGKPLGEDGLRLVVPGDQRGARSVKDVVSIEVK